MPCLHLEIRVLAIGDRLPSGGENLFEGRRVIQSFIDGIGGDAIDARAEGLAGDKVIGGVSRSGVDDDGSGALSEGIAVAKTANRHMAPNLGFMFSYRTYGASTVARKSLGGKVSIV